MRAGFQLVSWEDDGSVTLKDGSTVLEVWMDRGELGFSVGCTQFTDVSWSPHVFDVLFGVAAAPKVPTFESMDVWVSQWAPEVGEAFRRRKWRTWWRLFWIRWSMRGKSG